MVSAIAGPGPPTVACYRARIASAPASTTELVIWDFDGTIADTHGVIVHAFEAAFARHGLDDFDAEAARGSIGLPLAQAFEVLLGPLTPERRARLVADYRAAFDVFAPTEATMFAGMGDLLAALARDGVTQAITTSRGRASLEPMLARFGIAERFAAVITDGDVTHPKPHPAMVHEVVSLTGSNVERAMVIGDTGFDIEMGRRAGARTCGVTWGNQTRADLAAQGVDHIVDTVEDLASTIAVFTG